MAQPCKAVELPADAPLSQEEVEDQDVEIGLVYLMRSGRYYKIGRSNAAGRREREVALQLPEKATTVHVIRTAGHGCLHGTGCSTQAQG